MPFAEIVLAVLAVVAIYLLLRPLQRRLESYLVRKLTRRPHGRLPVIDVTDINSGRSHRRKMNSDDIDP